MAIEFISGETQHEAFIHYVVPGRGVSEYTREVEAAGIEAVKALDFHHPEHLAWVDLSKHAKLRIRHEDDSDSTEATFYCAPNYPVEDIRGKNISYGEAWLVTDAAGSELEFTVLSEILETNVLSEYAKRWLGEVASTNYRPAFLGKLDHHLTGASESSDQKFIREHPELFRSSDQ